MSVSGRPEATVAAVPGQTSRVPLGAVLYVLLTLGCAMVIVTAVCLEPDARGYGTHEQLGLPPCALLKLTGYPCATCGLTTSVTAMARGRVLQGFLAQPFGCILFAGASAWLLWTAFAVAARRPARRVFTLAKSGWCWGVLIAAYFASWIFKIAAVVAAS